MERVMKQIRAIAIALFVAGGFLGIYDRWQHHSSDKSFIIFSVAAGLSFVLAFVLYLFNCQELANAVVNLCIGAIFSVLTFTSVAYDHMFVSVQDLDVVDMLLIGSTFAYCCGTFLDRIHNFGNIESHFLTIREMLLLIGFTIGSVLAEHGVAIVLLAFTAVSCNLVAVHMKSTLSLVNALITSILVTMDFFPIIKVQYNPFCLGTFAISLSFEAIIDMYFSKYSTVDQLKGFLTSGKWCQKSLVFLFFGEFFYVASATQVTFSHGKVVFIVPFFLVFLPFWIAGHTAFFLDCWGLLVKLEECSQSLKKGFDLNTMLRVLGSSGVRHFCLISKSIVFITVGTTVFLAILPWQMPNAWFISSFLIVISIELMVYNILSSIGNCLGGTAIGYAIVIPCHNRNDRLVANRTAVNNIDLLAQFFSEHVVNNFGTELCTNGLTIKSLQSKLESFFDQCVVPGLPYDTFVLYYSGPVHDNGDWALLENNAFSLSQLLSLWERYNTDTGARLILVIDTETSYKWLPKIERYEHFVAAQVGIATKSDDVEAANSNTVGKLTRHWVRFNSTYDQNDILDSSTTPTEAKVRLMFTVSKHWCEFKFHVPTREDISSHIEESFPALVQPVMKFSNMSPQGPDLFCFCEKFVAAARYYLIKWLPLVTLDTGHGFTLVRR